MCSTAMSTHTQPLKRVEPVPNRPRCHTCAVFGNVTDPPAEWRSKNGASIEPKDETGAVVTVVDLHVENTTYYPNWVRRLRL